ncbi:gluconate kinase [Pedobacter sp. HMWF019]|uniref:gluconokinase n=1 Tax=Pedobacter sp. HMWF019 TaxID=2056856 RepID=UPI000D3A7273|nr:gluconokinase [Pedobacter sp. HMWF019]PTS95117.1 gluconate kinase [Pedobacter sp. HMWF019]
MIYIFIGVSGCGKTTLGKLFAERMHLPFYDADDFHPESNIQKMKNGISLNDEDRAPWLQDLARHIVLWNGLEGAVLACSALKESYRKILSVNEGIPIKWVFIQADFETLEQRLINRKGHFFNPLLLKSQLDTLEPPEYGIHLCAKDSLAVQMEQLQIQIA